MRSEVSPFNITISTPTIDLLIRCWLLWMLKSFLIINHTLSTEKKKKKNTSYSLAKVLIFYIKKNKKELKTSSISLYLAKTLCFYQKTLCFFFIFLMSTLFIVHICRRVRAVMTHSLTSVLSSASFHYVADGVLHLSHCLSIIYVTSFA